MNNRVLEIGECFSMVLPRFLGSALICMQPLNVVKNHELELERDLAFFI